MPEPIHRPSPVTAAERAAAAPAPDWTDIPGLLRELGPVGLLGVAWITLPLVALVTILAFLGPLSEWIQDRGTTGALVYVALFGFGAGLGMSPTHALALLGGWSFGFGRGLGFALCGVALGGSVGYAVSHLVGRRRIEGLLARDPRALAVRDALVGRGALRAAGIVTLLRVSPSSPFALSNLAFGTSGTRFLPYLVGTVLGLLPRTALVVSAGAAGAAAGARDLVELVREGPGLVVVLAGIALLLLSLGVVSHLAQRALNELELLNPAAPAQRT